MESESDEEMEVPVQDEGADDEDKSDAYGNLLTSEDNPWKLDTKGTPHLAEAASSLDFGNYTKSTCTINIILDEGCFSCMPIQYCLLVYLQHSMQAIFSWRACM